MALIVFHYLSFIVFCTVIILCRTEAENDGKLPDKSLRKKPPETNIFNFFRLFILRLIYGFASMFGLGDFLEDFADGAFAPPSSDYISFDYANDNDYKDYNDYDYYK